MKKKPVIVECDSCGFSMEEGEEEYCDNCAEIFCPDCMTDPNAHGSDCLDSEQ